MSDGPHPGYGGAASSYRETADSALSLHLRFTGLETANNRNAAQSCDLGADSLCFALVSQNAGIARLKPARGSGPAVGLPLSGADS